MMIRLSPDNETVFGDVTGTFWTPFEDLGITHLQFFFVDFDEGILGGGNVGDRIPVAVDVEVSA